jgi:3-deoxy-D-manno-octulosonic acid (KDO) 8-phosphate synthase
MEDNEGAGLEKSLKILDSIDKELGYYIKNYDAINNAIM